MGSVTVPFDSLTNAQGTGQRFELQGVGGMPGGHFVLHVQPAAVNHTTTTTTITTTTQGGMQSNGNVQQQMQTKAQKGGFGGALMGGGAGVGAMAAAGMMKRIPKFWNNA